MRHELAPSVEQLLDPEAMSRVEHQPVKAVNAEVFQSVDGLSGGKLARVSTDTGRRYVLKRFAFESDWIMRLTDDLDGRAVVAWTSGLLDQMPPEISPEIVAAARDGDGWA